MAPTRSRTGGTRCCAEREIGQRRIGDLKNCPYRITPGRGRPLIESFSMENEKLPEKAWEPTALSDSVREIRFESDRGAMLVGAAFIDDALYALLKAAFVDPATAVKRVLEYPGPCSALSARADVALATGAIGSEMHDDIRRIAKMRNRFAHDPRRATFKQPEVVESCKQFNVIRSMARSGTQMSISARTEFLITVAVIVNKLEVAIGTTSHAQNGPSYEEMPSQDRNFLGY